MAGRWEGVLHVSGFLEREVCGGASYAVRGGERFACAWHKDREPLVCPSALRVHRSDLESRIFGTIRERIFVPEDRQGVRLGGSGGRYNPVTVAPRIRCVAWSGGAEILAT
jgi:hypothetical protein